MVKRTPRKKSNKVFNQEVQSTEVVEVEELTAIPPHSAHANKENKSATEA